MKNIDYKNLLIKYISLVVQCEGIDFTETYAFENNEWMTVDEKLELLEIIKNNNLLNDL